MNNRIFKFRAWDKHYKHYVSVFELTFFNNPNYIVEQFTGLYDNDGKEIYEGDILKNLTLDFKETVRFRDFKTYQLGHGERFEDRHIGFLFGGYFGIDNKYIVVGNVNQS